MSIPDSETYRVVFKGVLPGMDRIPRLASKMAASPDQIRQMIASSHHVLARGLDMSTAQRYETAFKDDAVVVIELESEVFAVELPSATHVREHTSQSASENGLIRRIADYEMASGIMWIVLGVIQILTILGIIAGIWNIFVGIGRLKLAPLIRKRDTSVPGQFEPMSGLIIVGLINLFLAGC